MSANMRQTTLPFPRLGSLRTRAPAALARSAVASVEALSYTKIRAVGSAERNPATTSEMVRSSSWQGKSTATRSSPLGRPFGRGVGASVTACLQEQVLPDPPTGDAIERSAGREEPPIISRNGLRVEFTVPGQEPIREGSEESDTIDVPATDDPEACAPNAITQEPQPVAAMMADRAVHRREQDLEGGH